jgi:hypothetical protein
MMFPSSFRANRTYFGRIVRAGLPLRVVVFFFILFTIFRPRQRMTMHGGAWRGEKRDPQRARASLKTRCEPPVSIDGANGLGVIADGVSGPRGRDR